MKTSKEIRKEIANLEAQREPLREELGRMLRANEAWEDTQLYMDIRILDRRIARLKEDAEVAERYEVKEGDGVTVHYYSDAEAYTVIRRTPNQITIQRDKATLDPNFKPEWVAGGFAGHCTNQNEQTYTYERDPNGGTLTVRWSHVRGGFVYCDKLITNGRHEFYDYNF